MYFEQRLDLIEGGLLELMGTLEALVGQLRSGTRPAPTEAPVKEVLDPPAGDVRDAPDAVPEPVKAAPRARKPKPEPAAPAAQPEPDDGSAVNEGPTITESDVRSILVRLTQQTGDAAAAVAILRKQGGDTIRAVDPSLWHKVITEATVALGGDA